MTIKGKLSGKPIDIPDVNAAPMPALAAPGVIVNGQPAEGFGIIGSSRGYPDARRFRRKFGLVAPATNTSTEHELWSIILKNQGPQQGLRGVGLHTVGVITPRPMLESEADLLAYKDQFLSGLKTAVDTALLAEPEYMIMGMSLEHILKGIDEVRTPMASVEAQSGLGWATWHDAVHAALGKYGARRIGLLTGRVGVRISPFNPFNDIADSNPRSTFAAVADARSGINLAYLHVVEPATPQHGDPLTP